ncbi:MAG: lytic murein transglycosylase [Deltaproteobacteria bacterium]|nr:MAG: lytic murein transglycosylase [Deltaproteobacteria bacterium]
MKRLLVCICLLLTHLLPAHSVHAATIHPTFQGLVHRLYKDGMDLEYLTSVFSRPELGLLPEIVAKGLVRREARLNYAQFLEDYAVKKAISYLEAHKSILMEVEGRFGVSAPVVVAILCVETACGTYIGRYTTFNLLITQALSIEPDIYREIYRLIPTEEKRGLTQQTVKKRQKRKSRKAYHELKALLNYTRDHGIDPFSIQGSAEGAIGIPQFLPSNITVYGYDGDGNGTIDLFQHRDAIASVASFLKAFRWREDNSYKKKKQIIRRYNPSDYYADTVLALADKLKDSWP